MELNLTDIVIYLNGEETSKSYGQCLGEFLTHQTQKFDKIKAYEMGKEFYYKGILDMDRSDLLVLKEELELQTLLSNLISGEILIRINKLLI